MTDKPEVLFTRPMSPLLETLAEERLRVHRLYRAGDPDALLAEVGPRLRVVAVGAAAGFPTELWERLPALELIVVHGIGVDRVDLGRAAERGVRVVTTGADMTDDVADMAMALWLAAARRICAADRYVRDGLWPGNAPLPFAPRASGRAIGVLGLGRIGQAIARRAAPFASVIRYHNRRPNRDVPFEYAPSPVALAEASEVLFVAVSGGSASTGVVDARVLDALGPSGCLVNVARGSVVDEDALVAALAEGRLGCAGLDVFAEEPHVPEGLLALSNVVLQPHLGSATFETRRGMAHEVVAAVEGHFSGR